MKILTLINKAVLVMVGSSCIIANTVQAEKFANATKSKQSIVLGAGCFWGAEKRFEQIDGVTDATSGYADGKNVKPTYAEITKSDNKFNQDNYAEVVKVTYDSETVSLESLLKIFFENHNPTQGDRQGNDVGTQYRSTILYQTDAEKQLAEQVGNEYQDLLTKAGYEKITTKIARLETFYPAENYHQDYLKKNPNGYCPDHSTGVKFTEKNNNIKAKKIMDNSAIMKGKHIVILEASFCPYCEVFKKTIGDSYQGEIPMHYRMTDELDGLDLVTESSATPTIFFIENGKEVFGHQGLLSAEVFYQALGEFQLGKDSKAYEVAFEEGTESQFCKKYDLFKNTGEGVFVDALSGESLFDTKDRFDSGSGWLSFTQATPNSTIEISDNRFGMQRIEVRAQQTNIHLGHVFNDGPNGSRRYCINANVLNFKPRAE